MICLKQVQFYWQKSQEKPTLRIAELNIAQGEHVFLHGPSGSGKSTLLSLLCGINAPQSGQVSINGTDLSTLSGRARDQFRADHIGYIFQSFNLLPYLNPIENVTLACEFSTVRRKKALSHGALAEQAGVLLEQLGLDASLHHKSVGTLSIGQQQRVAAARAVIGEPELIIADEPTSALDEDNRTAFINLLFEQANKTGATVIFVSHERSLAPLFNRAISLASLQEAV